MGIDLAAGLAPRSTPSTASATAGKTSAASARGSAAKPDSAAGKPADQVTLSPQGRELATLQAAMGTAASAGGTEKTKAEQEAESRFMEAVKKFFSDRLGIDPLKVRGQPIMNKEALRYIVRNTVMGALIPPSLAKELGADLNAPTPKNGTLAEIKLEAKDGGPALARVTFDPAAMEELGRMPRKKKDTDKDGFFTVLDLMPSARTLKPGDRIDNGPAFADNDKRYAKEDDSAPVQPGHGVNRVVLTDSRNRPFFMARLRGDVEAPQDAAVNMCFSLVQFARQTP